MDYSIVQFTPSREGHSCGYCKSSDGNMSDGMWAHSLTVQDYQDLIDRGWRRSGQYCYKPKMDITCCPAYTIRCNGLDVRLTKSQKKILKKMRKFLIDGVKDSSGNMDSSATEQGPADRCSERVRFDKVADTMVDINMEVDPSLLKNLKQDNSIDEDITDNVKVSSHDDETVTADYSKVLPTSKEVMKNLSETGVNEQKKKTNPVVGMDPSKPQMKKAKLMRLERRERKLQERAKLDSTDSLQVNTQLANSQPADNNLKKLDNKSKSIEDFINEPLPENRKHDLVVRLVNLNVDSPETEALIKVEFLVYQKYQVFVHSNSPEHCTVRQFTRFLVKSPLKIKLVSCDEKEVIALEWALYAKYQVTVHHDQPEDCDYDSFQGFLVASPLKSVSGSEKLATGLGSYHQQYWLDGELIAVGVLDILPYCVSSVYFFYDPAYSFLSLGTYSSLREVTLMRELNQSVKSLEYYYMGFYIHSCPKMRYKSKIAPSYLLCPEVYTWHPAESCIPKLDVNKYSRLDPDPTKVSIDADVDLNKVLVLWKQIPMQFKKFKRLYKKEIQTGAIERYAYLVGKTLSQRLLYYYNN